MAEFTSDETLQETSPDVMASKMTLDFQADAYMRMKELGIKQKVATFQPVALQLGDRTNRLPSWKTFDIL